MCFRGLTFFPVPFLSFSLAKVLGSRMAWLGPVLWSVFVAVTLCLSVFPIVVVCLSCVDVDVCIPFPLYS